MWLMYIVTTIDCDLLMAIDMCGEYDGRNNPITVHEKEWN